MWYCDIVLFPELFSHPPGGMWYCGIMLFPELFAHPSGGMWAIAIGAEDMPGASREPAGSQPGDCWTMMFENNTCSHSTSLLRDVKRVLEITQYHNSTSLLRDVSRVLEITQDHNAVWCAHDMLMCPILYIIYYIIYNM